MSRSATAGFSINAGLLIGGVAIVGMLTPVQFGEGVIYDGRSIVLTLAGLVGGPITAAISALLAGGFRLWIGGAGALVGTLVVLEASICGIALWYLRRRDPRWSGPLRLWIAGLFVHVVMMGLQLLLPGDRGWLAFVQLSLPVLVLFPLGFLLLAELFLMGERRREQEGRLAATEQQREAIFDSSPLAFMCVDAEFRVTLWNDAAERLFGWSAKEVLGEALPIIPAEERADFEARVQSILEGERVTGLEVERLHKDGRRLELRLATAPLLGASGEAVGAFAAFEDLSSQKAAERALRESEQRFRDLVEGAPDEIFVLVDACFAYLNPAATRQFGAKHAEELIGTSLLDRIPERDLEQARRYLAGFHASADRLGPFEAVHVRFDGSEVPVEITAVPAHYDGQLAAIVFSRDISERLELERKYNQAQKMEAIGRLAGGVAHDFNNMLQTILGYCDMLLEELSGEDPRRRPIEQIEAAAQRSSGLTKQLLSFARKQRVEPRVVDLNAHLQELQLMLGRMISEDVRLEWSPCEEPCRISIDPTQLDQVLANLIINARDAMGSGGSIRIATKIVPGAQVRGLDAECSPTARFASISVEDDGSGMDEEILERACDPFFTTKSRDKGDGARARDRVRDREAESWRPRSPQRARQGDASEHQFPAGGVRRLGARRGYRQQARAAGERVCAARRGRT